MKQLINRTNPNIRIIADYIDDTTTKHWSIATPGIAPIPFLKENWILSDYEEPKSDKVEPIIEDDKTVGVKIPVINKAIYFADIKEHINWYDAVKYAASLGKKTPTYNDLCILSYFRKEIEEIYPKFKDLEDIWGEQYSGDDAWYLHYRGFLHSGYKGDYVFAVVPLADLPKKELEK